MRIIGEEAAQVGNEVSKIGSLTSLNLDLS
jgi:hypothetical protein